MKSILLHIADDSCMEARLQVAMDIARACEGHVTCLQAVSYEIFAPGDFYGSIMAEALPLIRKAAEEHRAKLEADLANEDVSWDWRFLHGAAESKLFEHSPLQDVIVVGPHDIGEDGLPGPSSMAGELALRAPAPVLVVPGSCNRLDVNAPVLIAWNGSSESCAALRAAIPLLEKSGKVYIVEVDEPARRKRSDVSSSEAAIYLSRHGIEAELVTIPRGEGQISDTLFAAASARKCGLVVMGAYGHSRLAELLLGGVTRRSLSNPQIPILLAH